MMDLFSWPRKALARFAKLAASREAMVKSSSLADATAMPPMTGIKQTSLANDSFLPYTAKPTAAAKMGSPALTI